MLLMQTYHNKINHMKSYIFKTFYEALANTQALQTFHILFLFMKLLIKVGKS